MYRRQGQRAVGQSDKGLLAEWRPLLNQPRPATPREALNNKIRARGGNPLDSTGNRLSVQVNKNGTVGKVNKRVSAKKK